jgi:uncharacterized membrane protein
VAAAIRSFDAERVARGLGWFSVALGGMEVLAPGVLGRTIGAGRSGLGRSVMRMFGLREIAAGVGILTTPRPAKWMTARVAGDVMDLAALVLALPMPSTRLGRWLLATSSVAGVLVLDAKCAQQLAGQEEPGSGTSRYRRRITIHRSAEDLYRGWRDIANQPRFMQRIESVRAIDDRRSHWTATAPGGMRFEWDSEITDERPGERLAWKSLPGSPIDMSGVVRFERAPGDRGTEVIAEVEYALPGGAVAAQLLQLIGQSPGQQLGADLRRFKQLMETGHVVTAEGASQGVGRPSRGRDVRRGRGVLSMLKGGAR